MKQILLLLVSLLLLPACSGLVNTSSNCTTLGNSGTCKLKIQEIEGDPYQHKINVSTSATSVEVTARVSAKAGTLNVWFEDPRGDKIMGKVDAGQSGVVAGRAGLENDSGERSFTLYIEPLGDGDNKKAEGIQAEIKYSMP